MKDATPQIIRRKDYRPPDFLVDRVDLDFDLDEACTTVRSRLVLRRNGGGNAPLVLDGVDLNLLAVSLNGEPVATDAYQVDSESLTLPRVPDAFSLEITTTIGGSIAKIEVAIITGQSAMSSPDGNICLMPMTIVFISGSVVIRLRSKPAVWPRSRGTSTTRSTAESSCASSSATPSASPTTSSGVHW